MLVEYIAQHINEDTQSGYNWIIGENYDFLYTRQGRESFENILAIHEELGLNEFDITEWNGYKIYHIDDKMFSDTFYFECPSGEVWFFSTYYKSRKPCKLLFPSDNNFNNW